MRPLSLQVGSALLELGLSLTAMGILAGLTVTGVGSLEKARQSANRQTELKKAEVALKTFVLQNNRLPFPDAGDDGLEDESSEKNNGYLPYLTLNLRIPEPGLRLRYGVWRGAGSDLVQPTKLAGKSPAQAYASAALAAASTQDATQPFIAGVDDQGNATNCSTAAVVPAYALMFASLAVASNPALCFTETPQGNQEIAFMSREEMAGWASAQMKQK